MVPSYCSHSHRSISLVQYSLKHDHLAPAQKAKVDFRILDILALADGVYFWLEDGQMPSIHFKPDKRIPEDVGRKQKDVLHTVRGAPSLR